MVDWPKTHAKEGKNKVRYSVLSWQVHFQRSQEEPTALSNQCMDCQGLQPPVPGINQVPDVVNAKRRLDLMNPPHQQKGRGR